MCSKPVLLGSNYCASPTHQKHDPTVCEEQEVFESRKSQIKNFMTNVAKTANTTLLLAQLKSKTIEIDDTVKDLLNGMMS
jgi:hypothetical protein